MTLLPGVDLDAEEREVLRAQKAKMLLDDPLLQEAFAYLEETYRNALLTCPIDQTGVMVAARTRLEMHGYLRRELQEILTSGTFALHQREERDEMSAWLAAERRAND